MKQFDNLYSSLLTEMPYIDVVQHGEHIKFDLELEKYARNLDGFKDLLRSILNKGFASDKYGNQVHLTNHDEKINFLSSLKDSSVVELFLKKYHNTTLLDVVRNLNN